MTGSGRLAHGRVDPVAIPSGFGQRCVAASRGHRHT
jgi:hypothetical protein